MKKNSIDGTDTSKINNTGTDTVNNQLEGFCVLALDFGVKKMGVALGNTLTNNARPLDILSMNNGQPNWEELLILITSWQAKQVIIGLPLNMDGTESMLAKRATKFARRLAHKLMEQKAPIDVYLHDERLSSREAKTIAWEQGWIKNERDSIDDISAVLLLNSYFTSPSLITDVTAYKA